MILQDDFLPILYIAVVFVSHWVWRCLVMVSGVALCSLLTYGTGSWDEACVEWNSWTISLLLIGKDRELGICDIIAVFAWKTEE
jgi:hypothetical protein